MKVLVIEDNEALNRNLVRYLSLQDIHTEASFEGKDGLYKASTKYYDAIILDIQLPEIDGIEICKNLREKWNATPIIMLTSHSATSDVITGLDAGADDYLSKPFDYEELIARLHSLTRRNLKNKSNSKIHLHEYEIDLESMSVQDKDKEIKLSKLEFELLSYFAKNCGRVISRQELYEKVWGESDNDFIFSKTVDVYIWYLRKKLRKDLIITKKWAGYLVE